MTPGFIADGIRLQPDAGLGRRISARWGESKGEILGSGFGLEKSFAFGFV
jgi:hypothetical protein